MKQKQEIQEQEKKKTQSNLLQKRKTKRLPLLKKESPKQHGINRAQFTRYLRAIQAFRVDVS
jgi:hypothetical protein